MVKLYILSPVSASSLHANIFWLTACMSISGIGLGKENVEVLIAKIVNARKSRRRWQDTKVLIIDEISMVDGSLFDKLEKIARMIREDDAPFGGIQVSVMPTV